MPFLTRYDLNILPQNAETNKLCDELIKKFAIEDRTTWYDWDFDMQGVSQEQPTLLFILNGVGEDGEKWRKCYFAGEGVDYWSSESERPGPLPAKVLKLIDLTSSNTNYKNLNSLVGDFNALTWAETFVRTVQQNPGIATDIETMTGWFANAIMAGYDNAKKGTSEEP